jgi:hypothetical protein
LGEAHADGVVSKATYERKRDNLRTLLARSAAMPAPQAVGVETIVPLLRNLPILLMQAINRERRTVVRELVTQVYVQRSVVMAIRPTKIAAALFLAAATESPGRMVKTCVLVGRVGIRPTTISLKDPVICRADPKNQSTQPLEALGPNRQCWYSHPTLIVPYVSIPGLLSSNA